jgi:hypothetical protein
LQQRDKMQTSARAAVSCYVAPNISHSLLAVLHGMALPSLPLLFAACLCSDPAHVAALEVACLRCLCEVVDLCR